MLRVGLTGGVGSGKSAVAAMLRDLGAHVSQSDEVGRALMQPGQAVCNAIVQHFGPEVLTATGELDRRSLARIAFAEERVEELNSIVHPAVIAAQNAWVNDVTTTDPKAVAVVESALIFETKHAAVGDNTAPWRTRFDRIVVIAAPLQLRRDRYIQRVAGSTQEAGADFDRRSAAQWTDERKSALADYTLRNGGTLEELRRAVENLFAALQQESADRAEEAM